MAEQEVRTTDEIRVVLQRLVETHDGCKSVAAVSVAYGTSPVGVCNEVERHHRAVRNAEIQFGHALNAARQVLKEAEPELLDPKLGWPAKWHHVDDVIAVLRQARAGKWAWFGNPNCKYIEVRVDMRDGGCVLMNRYRRRISPEQFAVQQIEGAPRPWPSRDTSDTLRSKVPNEDTTPTSEAFADAKRFQWLMIPLEQLTPKQYAEQQRILKRLPQLSPEAVRAQIDAAQTEGEPE